MRTAESRRARRIATQTFVAVPNGVEVDVVLVVADEKEAEPRVKGINRHNEEDANDVALLIRNRVGSKVCIDLEPSTEHKSSRAKKTTICGSRRRIRTTVKDKYMRKKVIRQG